MMYLQGLLTSVIFFILGAGIMYVAKNIEKEEEVKLNTGEAIGAFFIFTGFSGFIVSTLLWVWFGIGK